MSALFVQSVRDKKTKAEPPRFGEMPWFSARHAPTLLKKRRLCELF